MNETDAGWTFIQAAFLAELILIWAAWPPLVRRRARSQLEDLPGFAVIVIVVAVLAALVAVAQQGFSRLPHAIQALLISRVDLAVCFVWTVILSVVATKGAWRAVAAFGVFGLVEPPVPGLVTAIAASDAEEFWALCRQARSLTREQRVLIWLRHEAFAVILLFVAGFGILMAFGLPKHPLWIYLTAAVVAAILLHPARADHRWLARIEARAPARAG